MLYIKKGEEPEFLAEFKKKYPTKSLFSILKILEKDDIMIKKRES